MTHIMIHRAAMAAVFLLVAAGLAWPHEVTITYQAKLGDGRELQPGTYRLEVVRNQDATEVAFYQGRNLVIKIPAKLVAESEKCRQTEVHYELLENGRVINQIRVAGWKDSLVFREPTPASTAND